MLVDSTAPQSEDDSFVASKKKNGSTVSFRDRLQQPSSRHVTRVADVATTAASSETHTQQRWSEPGYLPPQSQPPPAPQALGGSSNFGQLSLGSGVLGGGGGESLHMAVEVLNEFAQFLISAAMRSRKEDGVSEYNSTCT